MDRKRSPIGCPEFDGLRPGRRKVLQAGVVAAAGLSLPGLFAARAAAATFNGLGAGARPGFGKGKACILIFQWGGPSHIDTWDPKPDAPAEVRGEFRPIATETPGLSLSEHFPEIAKRTRHLAVIRSMTHDDPAHLSTAHRVLTGHVAPVPKSDRDGPSPRDWPHLGAMLAKVDPRPGVLPRAVSMPWTVAHPAAPGGRAPGQDGGWLGKAFEPFQVVGDPNSPDFTVPGLGLPLGVGPDRLSNRRTLLDDLKGGPELAGAGARAWDGFRAKALDALTSAEARGAFDVGAEDPRLRDRYGRHVHGQCLLLARRLVEAGVQLVTVNWHDDGKFFWDTHGDNFNGLKDRLMPPADRGLAALLDDLEARGLLEETLVVWVGEFGRAPRITTASAGREHWPRCYSAALAGGGVSGGRVVGSSDRIGAYPSLDPVGPDDLGATILNALGIDPASEILDPLNRPMRINAGAVIAGLYG